MMKTMRPVASCSLSYRCLARVGSGDRLWDLARCTVGISALDPNILSPSLPSLFQADVRDEEALYRAFKGVDCVFHVASYGMSGAEKVSPPHATPGLRAGFRSWFCPPHPSCCVVIIALHPIQEGFTRYPACLLHPWDQMPILSVSSCGAWGELTSLSFCFLVCTSIHVGTSSV